MLSFFGRKKNEDENTSSHEDKKQQQRQLDELQDLTVLEKDDMTKLEGGKSSTRSFPDILGWSSSLGETIPQ